MRNASELAPPGYFRRAREEQQREERMSKIDYERVHYLMNELLQQIDNANKREEDPFAVNLSFQILGRGNKSIAYCVTSWEITK